MLTAIGKKRSELIKALEGKHPRSPQAVEAKRGTERLLSEAARRFRSLVGRSDKTAAAREALIDWLDVVELYLAMNLMNRPRKNAERVSLMPLEFLCAIFQDLDHGIAHPIARRAQKRSGRSPHGSLAVDFKVRCVHAADASSEKKVLDLAGKAAAAYGLKLQEGTIREWRRQMAEADPGGLMAKYAKGCKNFVRSCPPGTDIVEKLIGHFRDDPASR